jgi:hypothetical protein
LKYPFCFHWLRRDSEAVRSCQKSSLAFLSDFGNIGGLEGRGGMKQLYQWLFGRASFFRSDASSRGTSRTVRTEVTVERQGVTVLVGGAAADFDTCPLCGNNLAPEQAEQVRARLPEGPISQE